VDGEELKAAIIKAGEDGVKDTRNAFGREPQDAAARAAREAARRRLAETQ
jgi:hypothetical protein